RDAAAAQRPVAEHVAHAIAQLVAQGGNAFIRRPAVRAGVAAVFDQGDLRIRRPERVIPRGIDGQAEFLRDFRRHCAWPFAWTNTASLTASLRASAEVMSQA